MKFRKKPVVIDAIQLTVETDLAVVEFITTECYRSAVGIVILTLEGWMTARFGDWIIKGVKGEFYPCKPDIFTQTYEAVEEEQ